jgi:mannose-1-phosphate guanylyltransferase
MLEKTTNISVMACDFGWADVGAWTELHEVEDKDANYNAVITPTKVLFDNAIGNLVCLPDAKLAVISELEGYLIAEKDGVLIICPNGDAAMVRRLMTEAQMKLGEEFV